MSREIELELKPCPAEGEGVHHWIYYAACALSGARRVPFHANAKIGGSRKRQPSEADRPGTSL